MGHRQEYGALLLHCQQTPCVLPSMATWGAHLVRGTATGTRPQVHTSKGSKDRSMSYEETAQLTGIAKAVRQLGEAAG